MKQLIATWGQHLVVALDHLALLLIQKENGSYEKVELLTDRKEDQNHTPQTIHAVAITCIPREQENGGKVIIRCAVARSDKTLSMFIVDASADDDSRNKVGDVAPIVSRSTKKKVSSMAYVSLSDVDATADGWCLLCGDHVGDVNAHPVPFVLDGQDNYGKCKTVSKLLLGHTASLLTRVKVVRDGASDVDSVTLLTSDRDEKIRVSSFPRSFIVNGYLLGHTECITCMDAIGTNEGNGNNNSSFCVSGSTDGAVRLWDYKTCKALDQYSLLDEIEGDEASNQSKLKQNDGEMKGGAINDVTLHRSGSVVAVTRHDSKRLEILGIDESSSQLAVFKKIQHIDCMAPILSSAFLSDDTLCVVTKEPSYVVQFRREKGNDGKTSTFVACSGESSSSLCCLASSAGEAASICMPTTLFDSRESYQNPLLKSEERPENRHKNPLGVTASSRKQIAKDADVRYKKKKRSKKREDKEAEQMQE